MDKNQIKAFNEIIGDIEYTRDAINKLNPKDPKYTQELSVLINTLMTNLKNFQKFLVSLASMRPK